MNAEFFLISIEFPARIFLSKLKISFPEIISLVHKLRIRNWPIPDPLTSPLLIVWFVLNKRAIDNFDLIVPKSLLLKIWFTIEQMISESWKLESIKKKYWL